MKKYILSLGIITATLFATAQKQDLTLTPGATSFNWNGKKITGEHSGTISPAGGKFQVVNGQLKTGEIRMDMRSITCTDMEGEYADKLVGHLNSEDFFSTESHPEAVLKITGAEPVKAGSNGSYTHMIIGDLTIKGITHPVNFPAVIEIKDGKMAAAGEVKVDRTKYDIRYGSKNFFDNLGDKAIDNEFSIRFKVGAKS